MSCTHRRVMQHKAVLSQQYVYYPGLMPNHRSPGGLSIGLPVREMMRLLPSGRLNWVQSPIQALDTAHNVDAWMAAKRNRRENGRGLGFPRGPVESKSPGNNCKSRAQRVLDSPGTIKLTGGKGGEPPWACAPLRHKRKQMNPIEDKH